MQILKSIRFGAAIVLAAAAVGLLVSLWNYLAPMTGITGTLGALLVVVSSLLIATDAAILTWWRAPYWRLLLIVLAGLGILGTFTAGWFLHAWVLVGAMGIAAIGLAVDLTPHEARND